MKKLVNPYRLVPAYMPGDAVHKAWIEGARAVIARIRADAQEAEFGHSDELERGDMHPLYEAADRYEAELTTLAKPSEEP